MVFVFPHFYFGETLYLMRVRVERYLRKKKKENRKARSEIWPSPFCESLPLRTIWQDSQKRLYFSLSVSLSLSSLSSSHPHVYVCQCIHFKPGSPLVIHTTLLLTLPTPNPYCGLGLSHLFDTVFPSGRGIKTGIKTRKDNERNGEESI